MGNFDCSGVLTLALFVGEILIVKYVALPASTLVANGLPAQSHSLHIQAR